MKLHLVNLTAATLTAVALAAPVSAQDRGRHGSEGSSRGQAVQRAEPRRDAAPAPRREAAPSMAQAPRVAPRAEVAPRVSPRVEVVAPRVAPRAEVVAPRMAPHVDGYAVPRGTVRPNYNYRPYSYSYPVYRPYAFRPHFRLGIGLFVGYPVDYTYEYPYPVEVYGYGAPAAPVVVQPNSPYYGGIALEITPPDGAVYVDGNYVGVVSQFDGSQQPLTLTSGTHHIQITAPGYEPLSFDVQVQAGQVIPYQGAMQSY